MTARDQPIGSLRDHPALDIETVPAAVEGHPRFVQPRLRRHEGDRLRRYVWGVAHHQIHPAGGLGRQGCVQVALADRAAVTDVSTSAPYGDRVDIGRVQLNFWHSYEQSCTDRSGAAAQVHDYGS